jgi:hypothetical protein
LRAKMYLLFYVGVGQGLVSVVFRADRYSVVAASWIAGYDMIYVNATVNTYTSTQRYSLRLICAAFTCALRHISSYTCTWTDGQAYPCSHASSCILAVWPASWPRKHVLRKTFGGRTLCRKTPRYRRTDSPSRRPSQASLPRKHVLRITVGGSSLCRPTPDCRRTDSPSRACDSLRSAAFPCVCVCVCVCVSVCVRERERESDRESDRARER